MGGFNEPQKVLNIVLDLESQEVTHALDCYVNRLSPETDGKSNLILFSPRSSGGESYHLLPT